MQALAAERAAGHAVEHVAFYATPEFWVMIAFFILIGFTFRPLFGMITTALDKRAQGIADQIEEARSLREEAQELLASFERKQAEAEQEAEALIARARKEAEHMSARAAEDLEKTLARRQQQALDRIAQAEAKAVADVRQFAVDVALDATRQLLVDNIKDEKADSLIDAAIKELPEKLH